MQGNEPIRVCLGFPPLTAPHYLERLADLPGVVPVILPIDPDGDWLSISPGEPHAEPPPWARSVAREREAALASADVLLALHTPDRLAARAPNLRWVQGAGAGVEQFGRLGLAQKNVVLTNCSGLSSGSMAEWVIGRLLQVWKRLREADEFQRGHEFKRSYGRTFAGSTIGIVALGISAVPSPSAPGPSAAACWDCGARCAPATAIPTSTGSIPRRPSTRCSPSVTPSSSRRLRPPTPST